MPYLFTSESVSEGHPDKVADQISDALVDHFLAFDPSSKVACETLVTTGQVVLAGEVKSSTYLDVQQISRDVIKKIGYTKSEYMFEANSCGIFSAIHEQSPDINQGSGKKEKEDQGAGDQGMMFGYATSETDNYMPLALDLSHKILQELSLIRREGKLMKYLRPDAKSQVTIEYSDDNKPTRIDTIVVSTQHDDFDDEEKMLKKIKDDVIKIVMPRVVKKLKSSLSKLFTNKITYHINPTGKFVIGGPHGDTGLTGRKIIVDTYGGKGAHGGGAFSGKDPSKVDRSAAYATRHIAKNLVAAGICDEVLVQVSYAIGVARPTSIYVNTYNSSKVKKSDGEIAKILEGMKEFDLRPYAIEQRFKLRTPIYSEAAAYGHMGRTPEKKTLSFKDGSGKVKKINVETFPWEKLDGVKALKKHLKLKMILTDEEILTAIDKGEIVISPYDRSCLGTNSYDVHLSKYLATYRDEILDARKHNEIDHFEIPEEGYILKPGKLYLGSTIEYTETHATVPFLEGKSSVGRLGIDIHATAGKGDVGFCNHWTLEISCSQSVKVYAGMPIGQLIYFKVSGSIINYYNKKQNAKYNDKNTKTCGKYDVEEQMVACCLSF